MPTHRSRKNRRPSVSTDAPPPTPRQTSKALQLLSRVGDHPVTAVFVIAALITGLWLSPTYVYEDGMFYLRYAWNLASGYGLVYNPGEYYEGNTAFLWTILLTPAFWLGVEPVFYLRALGGLFAAGVLALTYGIVAATESRRAGLLAVVLLGTHYSFMIMAVSGFAPHLQSFFALLTLLLILRLWEKPGVAVAAGIGCCLSALLLTRLDSVLFAAVLVVAALCAARRGGSKFLTIALVGGLPALTFGCFLAWKLYYYGDIFPTTYYIKAGPQVPEYIDFFDRGMTYNWLYLREYWFVYLLPVFLYGAYCRLKSTPPQFSGTEAAYAGDQVLAHRHAELRGDDDFMAVVYAENWRRLRRVSDAGAGGAVAFHTDCRRPARTARGAATSGDGNGGAVGLRVVLSSVQLSATRLAGASPPFTVALPDPDVMGCRT